MGRRFSDRVLRRWLATGRPSRVRRRLDADPVVGARLDSLSELSRDQTRAISVVVRPTPGFDERATAGVHRRLQSVELAALVADMVGAGVEVVRLLAAPPQPDQAERDADAD